MPQSPAPGEKENQVNGPYMHFGTFITTPGQDLSELTGRGDAVLLAWAADYAPIQPMRRFTPSRQHQDTLFRVAVPVKN